jgi:UDP:flavonoid glycosyltransferase YjiC (YdhE family)
MGREMRILLMGFGSRGDVQPLIALGKGLQQSGYTATIAAGTNFQAWIEGEGLEFASIGFDVTATMLHSDSLQTWIEDSSDNPLAEARNMRRMMNEFGPTAAEHLWQIAQDADVITSTLPTFGYAQSIAEKTGQPHIRLMLQPMLPTPIAESTFVPYVPRHKHILNRVAGYVSLGFMWWMFKDSTHVVREKVLNLPPMTRSQFMCEWNHKPLIQGVSPQVAPHDPNWHDQVYTTGFWYHDHPRDWQPSPELSAFLQAGAPPVYVGFGSMSNRDPEGTTAMMIAALRQSGQRGIISSGWAGLKADFLPKNIFLLDEAPHDWLFPRMAAVAHHGGAGTTAAALRAGVPNGVVAHMGDQPYWGRRVEELGVGAPMIRRHQLNTNRLAQMIERMVNDKAMKERAVQLSEQICRESGVVNAVRAFDDILGRWQPNPSAAFDQLLPSR